MFTDEEPVLFVCSSCESEFEIKKLYSELNVCHCPFCGDGIETEQEDD